MDERWRKADDLLRRALELPGGARAAFLDRECGPDPQLRTLVERLVRSAEETAPGGLVTGGAFEGTIAAPERSLEGRGLGRYRIGRKIGSGGMGTVYEARDERLERVVAIKVLTRGVDDAGRASFLREARASAALNHPNIVVLHDAREDDGYAYLVMEFVDGKSLSDEPPRSLAEVLTFAGLVCDALEHAHARGFVHRDLKPANILVHRDDTGAAVKLADLGIALRTDASRVTRTGTIAGTPTYMAPEQALGRSVDRRADLYALGVMLYAWTTGVPPFRGGDALTVISQHIHAPVVPPRSVRPDVPERLESVILRLLAKDPEQRYSSAAETKRALRDVEGSGELPITVTEPVLASPAGTTTVDSIAVMPFVNDSGDPDTEYLSEGLTDSLIDNLSQLPRLRVMARSTVFEYQGATINPQAVGEQLGVRSVLTGRLTKRHDALVVRVELVDVVDGTRIWGKRFDRPVHDFLTVEEEIAREISDNLRFELTDADRRRLAKRHTENPDAHEAYLKGRYAWSRWKTLEGMKMSIGLFERALELDPLYARAFAGLADSYSVLGNIKALPPGDAYPKAKTAALQGLALDDSLAELHTSLGFVHRMWEWNWEASRLAYEKAIERNPGYATAHRWYAHLLAGLGLHDEAIVVGQRALALDPLSLIIRGALGDVYFYARRYDEAIALYRETIVADPEFLPGHTDLARALELSGRYEEAIAEFQLAQQLVSKGPPEPSSGLAHVYARMGRRDEALEIVDALLEIAKTRYVSPYGIGSIYACLGDNETSLDWLDRAYAEHDQTLVWVKAHPRLDRLRDEPRYRDLLRRMRL